MDAQVVPSDGGSDVDGARDARVIDASVGDAGLADASADAAVPQLRCERDERAVGAIERGSENGLERVITLVEIAGELAAVWTSADEVALVRVPAGATPIRTTITTTTERPTWPTAVVVDGVLHAGWVEPATGVLRHARARGDAWEVGRVANTRAGALVRGAARVEAVWIAESGRAQLASLGDDGAWTSMVLPAWTQTGAGPLDALRDGAGRLHYVHAADGMVSYVGEDSPEWRSAIVVSDEVDGVSAGFEASVTTVGSEVWVGHASGSSVGVWRFDPEGLFVPTGAPVPALRRGLGIALTDDDARSYAVYAYASEGGPMVRTPVSLAVGDDAPIPVSTRAYAFSPAVLRIGDTLHVMWAEWSGLGPTASVQHARCTDG